MAAIIYTGPTDKKLGLRNRAIYRGGLPEHLRSTIESNSALANFFVPLSRYAKRARKPATGPVSAPLARGPVPVKSFGPPIRKK